MAKEDWEMVLPAGRSRVAKAFCAEASVEDEASTRMSMVFSSSREVGLSVVFQFTTIPEVASV